ncbi:MAG: CDP-alcohol phosphatidyltransferase family protein [Candidatus Micrarchaeota archaeon]
MLFQNFRSLELKDWLSLANAACGAIGIVLAAAGFAEAAAYVVFAVLFDYLDGKFARKTRATAFGKELDSLADAVSFVAAPAFVVVSMAAFNWLALLGAVVYVCCGVLRLAWFNVQKDEKAFYGVPSPAAAAAVIALGLALPSFGWVWLLLGGASMVLAIKIPKPKL